MIRNTIRMFLFGLMLISVVGCASRQRNRSIYEAQKSGDYNKLEKELEKFALNLDQQLEELGDVDG